MDILAIFLQSIFFQLYGQTSKRLREKGVSEFGVLRYFRHALYPSIIFLIVVWDQASFDYLLASDYTLFSFVGFLVLNFVCQYLFMLICHMTRSYAFLGVFFRVASFPLWLLGGWLINHDIPTLMQVIGVGILFVALLFKPSNHPSNVAGKQFRYALWMVATIVVFDLVLGFFKNPLYREYLTSMPNVWFAIALFLVAITLMYNLIFWIQDGFAKLRGHYKPLPIDTDIRRHAWLIPLFWFLASIPEGYAFASVPIYVFASVGSISFLMNLASDLHHKRVILNARTMTFAGLTLAGIVVSILGK